MILKTRKPQDTEIYGWQSTAIWDEFAWWPVWIGDQLVWWEKVRYVYTWTGSEWKFEYKQRFKMLPEHMQDLLLKVEKPNIFQRFLKQYAYVVHNTAKDKTIKNMKFVENMVKKNQEEVNLNTETNEGSPDVGAHHSKTEQGTAD